MAAAPPPLMAHREGGDAPVSLFLDTDLGTHLALLVAPDTDIRGLKSQVAAEHAVAFPDLGPVIVKSFQVRRKGVLYHLSDSMTVMSVFTKIKGGCFLHVNMAEATAATHCCQDAPAADDRRMSDVCLGIHVKNHAEELLAMAPDVACDMLSRGLEGGNDDATLNNVQAHVALPNCTLVPSSSQPNSEILKNKAVGLASATEAGTDQIIDKAKSCSGQIKHANQTEGAYISFTSMACVDKSSNESNLSHAVDELHASRDHGIGDDVSDKKQVRVEEQLLEEIQAKDTLSQAKEHKKSRTGSFDTSCTALLETGTTSLVESLNTSNHQEVHNTLLEESIQLENPSTVGKKKKRKRRQLSPSKSASAQETTEPSAMAVDLLKSTGEVLPHNSLGIQIHNIHAMDNLSQEKEHKKSRSSSPDTSSRHLLETDPTSLREPLNTSNHQVHDTSHQESIQLENPSPAGKKKKKKRRQLASSKSDSAQITTEALSGTVPADLSKSTGDEAHNVELTGKDVTIVKASGLPLSSSELNDGNQGGINVQFVSDAQASPDVISEQEKFDHALKGCRDASIAEATYSTDENVAIEGKTTKGSCAPLDGGDKHEEIKQHNEGCHNEGVPETSNMEKDGKSTDVSDKRQTNQNTSQVKKRKKSKVGSVDMPSVDVTGEKDHGYSENAAKQDTVSTKSVIVHEPSTEQMSNTVYQGDSNVIEIPSGDGKKKKKRRRHSESLKGVNPSQDLTKSSGFITNESSIHCTNAAPIDAKQTTPDIIEGETVTEHKKLSESLDVAATNVIDEVLADLRSKDSLVKDLDGDLLPGQTHLGRNQNGLEVPESIAVKVGSVTAALPPKYPATVHSTSPVSSPRQKKSKGKKSKVLPTMTGSSHQSSGVPEDANRELKQSDSLRFADNKTSDPEDIVTGNVVVQADDKHKATKRRRKKGSVKQVLDTLDLKEANDTEENLVQGGSVVYTPLSTVGKVEQKDRPSETLTPKIRETNCSSHGLDSNAAKDNQDEYVTDIIGTHDNENAAGTPTLHVVQKDAMALKSASPNSQKEGKTSSNSVLQSQDCALEHGFSADLVNSRTEKGVRTTSSASAVKPDYHTVFHPANDGINFLEHFSCSNMNDAPPIAAESKQNNEDESLREVKKKKKKKPKQGTGSIEPNDILESLPSEKASLTGHFGTSKAIVPSVAAEIMYRENENVNNVKEKKRKGKANMDVPTAEKDNPNCDSQGIDIGTQASLISIVQKETMGQDNGKESNSKVTQNASIMQHEPEGATWNHTPEKNLHQSVGDDQSKLLTEKDHAHISKEARKFTSQTKPHAKIRKPGGSTIKEKVAPNPKPVSNLVKDFSMSPRASSDSTEGMPPSANRYRVAVRKVPSKRYEETSGNSKKASRKVGSGAIFNDSISEGSGDELDTKTVMEVSPDSSSTSADSGISCAAYDESEIPDDDGTVSLSQRSLKGGVHIGSILRGSRSYKKARKKQAELLDDDTIVPDSQPTDGLWG